LVEEFLEVLFILSGWKVFSNVGVPLFVRSFENGALNGASLTLVGPNFSVEVFMRHIQLSSPFWEIAA
jgi:hypothetical protein